MELQKFLEPYGGQLLLSINSYDGSRMLSKEPINFSGSSKFRGADWKVSTEMSKLSSPLPAARIKVSFRIVSGTAHNCSVSAAFQFNSWSVDNYVLMPSVAYNGNRFESRKMPYPPLLSDPQDIGADVPVIISDVPRLNLHDGVSKIDQTTRDPATPAFGFFAPHLKQGVWMLTESITAAGISGLAVEENESRSKAEFVVTAPAVREDPAKQDRGKDWRTGDEITLQLLVCVFPCSSIQELFDHFLPVRKLLTGSPELLHSIPFSAAWAIQEQKYNAQNWENERSYYSVGMRESAFQDWQVGWVGGGMATHPLLFEGSSLSRERALKTLDFLFSSQTASGFLHGMGHQGEWYGDGFFNPHADKWHLIRKSSDALYFVIKQFMLLDKMGMMIHLSWIEGTRKLADAFMRLWNRYGQFGQFIHVDTGEIIVGGSTSASTAPAGLALAGQYFGVQAYLDTAEQAAVHYYERDVMRGVTTGGPGEILQCPDSESAFGLLESFVVLYEVTGDQAWIAKAKDMANQCATWCVSYDFAWPEGSEFGRLGMKSAGSVIANVQNKHSAPGICTLSGDSLFKLYRATDELFYLEMLRETAHNLPQYLSRTDRPIRSWDDRFMEPGWMSERVNMSDWEGKDKIGEIGPWTCWCEVSNMLTFVEVPGLYVQPDTGFFCAFDHVDVELVYHVGEELTLKITNPTTFEAEIKIFAEPSRNTNQPLGQNALYGCLLFRLAPGQTEHVNFHL